VRDFLAASSMGTFYNASIKDSGTRGRFSCKEKNSCGAVGGAFHSQAKSYVLNFDPARPIRAKPAAVTADG
jgi:hypothetical protein